MKLTEAIAALEEEFAGLKKTEFRGETTLTLDPARLLEVCEFAKGLGFDGLLDISGVDLLGKEPRFEVAYQLYSFLDNHSLRLKIAVSEENPEVPSVSGIWSTANWHEREVYDLMGIRFTGHPDLRRILMWDDYPYHPLRKDFPLAGLPVQTPDVAFSEPAPLEGGPFTANPQGTSKLSREPRARS